MDAGGCLQHILSVSGFCNGPTVTEDNDVRVDGVGGIPNLLNGPYAIMQGGRGGGPNGAGGGQAHVGDDDIGPGLGHPFGLVDVEDIWGCQQTDLMGGPDHLDFLLIAHAGFFEVLPEFAVNQTDGGEVLDSAKAQVFQLFQEKGDGSKGIGGTDSGQDRLFLHDG